MSDQLSMSIDVMPTMLELAGIGFPKERPFDGQSLAPTLLDEKALKPRQLFWNYQAMRDGPWKLILAGRGTERDSVGLYNLVQDIGESNNLAETYPERVAAMRLQLNEWSADVRTNVTPQPVGRLPKAP